MGRHRMLQLPKERAHRAQLPSRLGKREARDVDEVATSLVEARRSHHVDGNHGSEDVNNSSRATSGDDYDRMVSLLSCTTKEPTLSPNCDESRWWLQLGIGGFRVRALYDPGAALTVMGSLGLQIASACGRALRPCMAGKRNAPMAKRRRSSDTWICLSTSQE